MEHPSLIHKFSGLLRAGRSRQVVILAGLFSLAAISLTLGMRVGRGPAIPGGAKSPPDASARESFFSEVLGRYAHLLVDIQRQVEELERADEENGRLKAENAHLRLVIEAERFDRDARQAESATRGLSRQLGAETGSAAGRTLAAIPYQIPKDLLPAQLHELGLRYFRSHDDERAAVILTFLTGLDSDARFKTAEDYLLTGICWYRLENYRLADSYFDKARKASGQSFDRGTRAQLRLWKALAAQRMNQHGLAQHWLEDLLNHSPHSREAEWVNPLAPGFRELHSPEANREPAARNP